MHEVVEGVEDARLDRLHLGVVGVHQRDLLLEHQHAGRDRRHQVPAIGHRARQHRQVGLLVAVDAVEVAQFQLGHAAAGFALDQLDLDAVVAQHHGQVLHHLRHVVVAVAGGEDRDPAAGGAGRLRGGGARGQGADALAAAPAVVLRQRRLAMHAQGPFQQRARGRHAVGGIHHLRHHGNRRDAAHGARGRQQLRRGADFAAAELLRLGAQHHVREVEVPRVRRHVGALGLVAQVAQVALVDHLGVVGLGHAVDFHRARFVDQVEQGGEGVAQADAAAAAMADVEDALELAFERCGIPEAGRAPVQRMAGRRVEAALALAFAWWRRVAHGGPGSVGGRAPAAVGGAPAAPACNEGRATRDRRAATARCPAADGRRGRRLSRLRPAPW